MLESPLFLFSSYSKDERLIVQFMSINRREGERNEPSEETICGIREPTLMDE